MKTRYRDCYVIELGAWPGCWLQLRGDSYAGVAYPDATIFTALVSAERWAEIARRNGDTAVVCYRAVGVPR